MNCTHKAALQYIEKGWSVVPIPHGEKGPNLKGWPKLRITAGDAADHYFGTESNVGLLLGEASGGIVCIDLDHDFAVELAERFLPPTGLIAGRTQRPGTHRFYIVSGELKSKSHKLPDTGGKTTVEILSDGRQVVVGPSVHPSGDVYDVLGDGEPATVDAEELFVAVGMLHAAVLDRLGLQESQAIEGNANPICRERDEANRAWIKRAEQLGASAEAILSDELPQTPRQPSGNPSCLRPGDDFNERGDVRELLRRHLWQFVSGGANEHWRRPGKDSGTSATLKDGKLFYNFSGSASPFEPNCCYSPFGVFAMLEHGGDFSAATGALRAAGYGGDAGSAVDVSRLVANVAAPDADEFDADDLDDTTAGPLAFPSDYLTPPGLLGDISRYNLETALYPQPQLALGGALALLATISGRKITDAFGTRPNCYILALGPSGCGKEHSRKVNKRLLRAAGGKALLGPERIGSHQGLISHLALTASKLFQIDEIHRLLETMSNPSKAPHLYGIGTVLLTLYSASDELWESDGLKDVRSNYEIDRSEERRVGKECCR